MPDTETPKRRRLGLPQALRVMVSSRNTGTIGQNGASLEDLRARLASELAGTLFGQGPVFEIYLNELDAAATAETPIVERCRELVRLSDIVLVLYDGRAGWSAADAIGICHTEFATAMNTNPRKVRVIALPEAPLPEQGPERERDEAFREAFAGFRPWTLFANTADEAVDKAKDALFAAVIELSHDGSRASRGRTIADSGAALDWTRMNYRDRAAAMISSVRVALQRANAEPVDTSVSPDSERMLVMEIAQTPVLVRCHAVPAAMSETRAREMVGQPFLLDYQSAPLLAQTPAGPLHLIACARGVTEAQAVKQLGHPDATIVSSTFGVYVADPIEKMQLVFLSQCRDETMTAERVEDFLNWLDRTAEDAALRDRAIARAKIVSVLAAEAPK